MPGIGIGEGGSFSLGADGGPIHSSDRFDTSFDTGSFSLRGGSTLNQVSLLVAGLAVGIVLCLLFLNRS